nr:MAG TPA: hypothetical protein [Caudoviricetes sp.]
MGSRLIYLLFQKSIRFHYCSRRKVIGRNMLEIVQLSISIIRYRKSRRNGKQV